MKKVFNQFSKIFIMLWLLFIGVENAFSVEVTVSKSVHDLYPNDANETQRATLYSDSILSISVNPDGNNGKIYGTGTEWRLYQTNSAVVTVETTNAIIKTVAFEFIVKNTGILKYGNVVISSNTNVNINASSSQFNVSNSGSATNGQVIIKGFTVIYEKDGSISTADTTSQDTTIIPIDPELIEFPEENIKVDTVSVNGISAYKVGTSKLDGTLILDIPQNTIGILFYAAAWKDKSCKICILKKDDFEISNDTLELIADVGITGNSPFTIETDLSTFLFELDLSGVNIDTQIALIRISGSDKRFVIWGINYKMSSTPTPIETPQTKSNTYKIMKNREIQIHRDNKVYNIYGNLINQ